MSKDNFTYKYKDFIYAFKQGVPTIFKESEIGGKWLIFSNMNMIMMHWNKIKHATLEGQLGNKSKVSLVPKNGKTGVIYVYVESDDLNIINDVRDNLRLIGITNKIPFKPNKATKNNIYSKNRRHIQY